MSYEFKLSGLGPDCEGIFLFGSAKYLTEFCDWVETLPEGVFPTLRKLAADLKCTDTLSMAAELRAALEVHPPEVEGLGVALSAFADQIGDGFEEETIEFSEDFAES